MSAKQTPLPLSLDAAVDPVVVFEADAGEVIYFDPFLNEWMPLVEDK